MGTISMLDTQLGTMATYGSVEAPTNTLVTGRYPKRRRTQVNYGEVDTDESASESEDDADERAPPQKVRHDPFHITIAFV